MRFILFILTMFIFSGCAIVNEPPKMTLYSFEDTRYPCIKVEFPEQIKYEKLERDESDSNLFLKYMLLMPGYKVEITKFYTKEGDLSFESLPSLYSGKEKVYEVYNPDETPEKSAVITLMADKEAIYLEGSVAEYLQNNIAVRVDIFRPIKRSGIFASGTIDNWRNSTGGIKNIENMQNVVDFIFNHISTVNCQYKTSIERDENR